MISIIVAADQAGVIGKDGGIPWNLPADMDYFRQKTSGHPVVMGRKTYESIGRPLPNRQNIVITRNKNFSADGVQVAATLDKALALAQISHVNEIFIIGGEAIYQLALPKADKLYLTRVHTKTAGGDTFFKFNQDEWEEVDRQAHKADAHNAYNFDFITLQRKVAV